MSKNILIIGGAGYVGTMLSSRLTNAGHQVFIYDTFWYIQEDYFINEKTIRGDIRNINKLSETISKNKINVIIHLACVSNDPSYELNPDLGKSINFDCFEDLVKTSKNLGVQRFIYASSSSVYGVKKENDVIESLSKEPLTDYSKYKSMCEEILLSNNDKNFVSLIVRPATVCGYSPRLRLDLSVNILTAHAFFNKKSLRSIA